MPNQPGTTLNQPGMAVLTMLDELIDRIKSTRPLGTDNKPIETSFVYSQLPLGQMVDPDDFNNPWTPSGGISLGKAVATGALSSSAGAGVDTGAQSESSNAEAMGDEMQRAMTATYKTSSLVDRQLMVTRDENMRLYPAGRSISMAYETIIHGMQPVPAPPLAADVQKRLDEARKVLYDIEPGEEFGFESKLYERYIENAQAYADAKREFAEAQAEAMGDPKKAEIWPMTAASFQAKVDRAYKKLIGEGAEKVERALGVVGSIGVSVQDKMISKAREALEAWKLQLAGVPTMTPYSYVMPSGWSDPDDRKVGWQTLKVTSRQYKEHSGKNSHFFQQSSSHSDASSTGGGASASFFGFGGSVGGSSSSTHNNNQGSSTGSSRVHFHNDAQDLEIELEYGLCDIYRPWLIGDLFYLKNWYLVNNRAKAISDGTFDKQADSDVALLPMIPHQFLVVRNVRISARDWGKDEETLKRHFGMANSNSDTKSSKVEGEVEGGWGPFSYGASASHSSSEANSSQSSMGSSRIRRDLQATFDEGVLTIRGAQIIAYVSSIVPACAPLDDPGMPAAPKGQTGTTRAPSRAPA